MAKDSQKQRAQKPVVRAKSNNRTFLTLLGVVAAGFLGFIVYQANKPAAAARVLDPGTPLPEAAGYALGKADAPVTVLEFADFECPACGQFFTLTEPDIRTRLIETGQILYKFYDYPLPIHKNTWPASHAAACANEQGKFWEMHDALFNTQDRWSGLATTRPKGILEDLAKQLGLDMAQWESCYDSEKYLANITAHMREGERLLVGSTPTFVIGKRMVPGSISYDKFKAYVDSALADAAGAAADSATPAAKSE